jgi:hypothetical protein
MREHAVHTLLRPSALRRAVILFAVAWAAIGPATAHARGPVTVMTQNIYQGTEFAKIRALAESKKPVSFNEAIAATTTDYATYQATNFKERAKLIASEIAQNKPVFVGLQEVATWHKGEFNPLNPFGLPAPVSEDFTKVLIEAIEADGLHYQAVSETARPEGNFTLAFPVAPGPAPYGLTAVGMVERGVILARSDLPAGELQLSNPQSGTYSCEFCKVTIENPLTKEVIPFTDSWESIDANFEGRAFRFITTHLDALEPTGIVRYLQAKELIEGPANSPLPVVVVGDFNNGPNTLPPPYGPAGYDAFIQAGFTDTWTAAGLGAPPLTCCHKGFEDRLNNPNAEYTEALDHVLIRGNFPILGEHLVGNTVASLSPPPEPFIWPSDHAGVVATFGPKVISGQITGPLVVKNGEWIELTSAGRITGPVTVDGGGALDVEGGRITGPVKANGAAQVRLCGATITGPVEAINGIGSVVIGEGTSGCAGGIITGPVTLTGNTAGVLVEKMSVTGPLTVTGNTGGTTVTNNHVVGPLTVTGNGAPVVDKPNSVTGPSKLQ